MAVFTLFGQHDVQTNIDKSGNMYWKSMFVSVPWPSGQGLWPKANGAHFSSLHALQYALRDLHANR